MASKKTNLPASPSLASAANLCLNIHDHIPPTHDNNDTTSTDNSNTHRPRSATIATNSKMTDITFEIPVLWETAMMLVSSNAGLHPQMIVRKYKEHAPRQHRTHPGYIDLDIGKSQQAAARGTKMIRIYYDNEDPGLISLMAIFIDQLDPRTKKPVPRLLTNTSLLHVLEEPRADCQLWLKVHTDVGPHAPIPYQIIPCCKEWAECADFRLPMSAEEKAVPAIVSKLIAELRGEDKQMRYSRQVEERPYAVYEEAAMPTAQVDKRSGTVAQLPSV